MDWTGVSVLSISVTVTADSRRKFWFAEAPVSHFLNYIGI
jgi:hypothetical protein